MAYDPLTHRKKIPPFPSIWSEPASLRNDPAKMKGGFVGRGGVNPGYASQVSAFNKDLYAPSDTKPGIAAMPTIAPLSTSRGEQISGRADLERIAGAYGGKMPTSLPSPSGVGSSPFRTISSNPNIQPTQLTGQLPAVPDFASPAPMEVPEFPETTSADIPPVEGLSVGDFQSRNTAASYGADQGHEDDATHAGNIMSEFDALAKSVASIGAPQAASGEVDGGMSVQDFQATSKAVSADAGQTGSRNTPFNKTDADNWGTTALDQRPQSSGPAASSVRYYERAMARAQGGSRADANRIQRLDRRINARPTNDY